MNSPQLRIIGSLTSPTWLRQFADAGTPEKSFTDAGDTAREAIEGVVRATAGQVSIRSAQQIAQSTLSIE